MAVIIRLQNLPLSANTLDIREYFKGLCIPEGGVHIVGGEFGDAFIGFATDEDARQAMNMTNQTIKESRIRLLLSSRNEMQNVILAARERQAKLFMAAASLNGDSNSVTHLANQNSINTAKANNKGEHNRDRSTRSKSRSVDRFDHTRDRHRSRSRSPDRKRVSNESSYNPNARVDPRTVNKKSFPEKVTNDRDTANYTTSGYQAFYTASSDITYSSSIPPFYNLTSTSLITPAYNSSAASNMDNSINVGSSSYATNYNPLLRSSYAENKFNPLVNSALYPPPLPFFIPQRPNLPLSTMPSLNQHEYQGINPNTTAKNVILSNPNFTINDRNMLINSYDASQIPFTPGVSGDKRVHSFTKYFVEVGNIPVEFRLGDIEDFFSGCDLWQGQEGIVEILGPRLESTDKLILRLRSESGYQRALAKNGQRLPNFKNRVEVFPSFEERWFKEKSRQNKSGGEMGSVNTIDNTQNSDNYVSKLHEFYNQPNEGMGTIDNLPANNWVSGIDPRIKSSITTNRISPSTPRGFCVKLRNLAYEADSVDVQRFFKDLHILNLHIETNDNGKRTGMAYVEFATKKHLDAALDQHKMKILDRSVLIEEISKMDVIEIVRQNVASLNKHKNHAPIDAFGPSNLINKQQQYTNQQNFLSNSNVCSGFFAVHVSNLPTSFTVNDIASMFTSHNINPKSIHLVTDHGKMVGQAFVELHNVIDMNAVVTRLNGLRIGLNNVVNVASALNLHEIKRYLRKFDPMDWPNDSNVTNNFQKNSCFRSSLLGKATPNFPNGSGPSPAQGNFRFGLNQRTIHKVKIKNLPDDVTADDIIDLFKPFHCIPHTLQIIHMDGNPTGEATLGFPNPQACNRVLEAMNGKSYKCRKLSLALLSH